jgi:uncharacterized repeat protein (TIGR03809 family)
MLRSLSDSLRLLDFLNVLFSEFLWIDFGIEMANSGDAKCGRSVTARWRMLAERRLNYLIELYETGRWKIYYKEPEFLKAIQEARAALRTWEQLAPPDPVQDKPVEVEIAQTEKAAIPESPFAHLVSTNGVKPQDDLRKA